MGIIIEIIEGSFKYMQENYRQKLLIRGFGQGMGFNGGGCTRLFKLDCGTTPTRIFNAAADR